MSVQCPLSEMKLTSRRKPTTSVFDDLFGQSHRNRGNRSAWLEVASVAASASFVPYERRPKTRRRFGSQAMPRGKRKLADHAETA
jgi:hypothetical protein